MTESSAGAFEFDRTLLKAGTILFLLGLLTGLVVPAFAVPRIGLSSHLEGIFNGVVLIALGLMCPRLHLTRQLQWHTFSLAIYGTYTNWFVTLISAASGAAGMMPISGGGSTGGSVMEGVVAFMLITLSIA